MTRLWKIKPQIPEDLVHHYRDHDPLLAQLLHNRGIKEKHQIDEFLNPQYERLNSPFLFKDMEKAVERIWQAIERNEKITIYGDYDADAVTANAVLRQTFSFIKHQNIDSYIPDRFSEGYGVNLDALSRIKDKGSRIIITVDCGTNSVDAAEFCKANGIDLIITDHHEIIGPVPKAFALINPKNPNDDYPDANITGVGVAFKLACAILNKLKVKERVSFRASASEPRNLLNEDHQVNNIKGIPPLPQVHSVGRDERKYIDGYEKWLLDLVAIGTVADCHELLGENRILVKYGLKVLEKTKWVGLRALIKLSGLDFSQKPPDTYTLGFVIAPRLNAAGRLEHANTALNLLLETNALQAGQKAQGLEELNKRRQDITARILSEAREQALSIKDRKVLVIMNNSWHKGVVGLVAGKIAEEFYKPTIVLQMEAGEATGSARSVGDFDIVAALKYSESHLVRFGGHKAAAGLTLLPENFELFYRSVLDYADDRLMNVDMTPVLELEAEIYAQDLQLTTYNLTASLEPFGVGNPRPKFLIKNARVLSQRPVGGNGQHLQLQIKAGDAVIPAIAFNFQPLKLEELVDIACELMEDGWNGRRQLKLKIVDIKQIKN